MENMPTEKASDTSSSIHSIGPPTCVLSFLTSPSFGFSVSSSATLVENIRVSVPSIMASSRAITPRVKGILRQRPVYMECRG